MKRSATVMWGVCVAAALGATAVAGVAYNGETIALHGTTPTQSPWMDFAQSGSGGVDIFRVYDDSSNQVFVGGMGFGVNNDPRARGVVWYHLEPIQGVGDRWIESVTIMGLRGLAIDTDYLTNFSGQFAPYEASRSMDGDLLTFRFERPAQNASLSRSFFVYTNAPSLSSSGSILVTLNTGESVVVPHMPVPKAGPTPFVCGLDTNNDGMINFADLNAILTSFGMTCDNLPR